MIVEAEMMNGCLSRQRSAVFQAFAVKCQIVDKLLDMTAGDLVKSEVSDCRIHSHGELFHTLIRYFVSEMLKETDDCFFVGAFARN